MSQALGQVDFHSGVADKLPYVCRLVRKAWRSGRTVVVTGRSSDLSRLDQLLWTFDPGEFIPHARLRRGDPPEPRLARSPVCLADDPADAPHREVLVNLGPDAMGVTSELFARAIEIVGTSPDEVAAGRERWRQYKAGGQMPSNHAQGADAG